MLKNVTVQYPHLLLKLTELGLSENYWLYETPESKKYRRRSSILSEIGGDRKNIVGYLALKLQPNRTQIE